MKCIGLAGILLGLSALVTGQSAVTGVTGNLFVSVPPCRAYDSRFDGTGALNQDEFRVLTLTGKCGVPTGVVAVSANIAAANIQGGAATNGVLKVGLPPPQASTGDFQIPCGASPCEAWLNFSKPWTTQVNNSGTAVVNTSGQVIVGLLQGGGTADVIIDVNGYFIPGVPAASFAAGAGSCGTSSVTSWSKCSTTIQDGRIKAGSFVFAQYKTRLADDQIPTRVYNIVDGAFSVEMQGGTSFLWFAYLP
ncbi:MAG TPA: hypothetical protein VK780_02275 [Thermoanaerobaculia bacterium]|nr:hypothetical protein [Thermoanaerobaculia bacterium]